MKQGTLYGWRSAKGKEKETPMRNSQAVANGRNGDPAAAASDTSMADDEEDDSFITPPPPAGSSTANTSMSSAAGSSKQSLSTSGKKRAGAQELSHVEIDRDIKASSPTLKRKGSDGDGDVTMESSARQPDTPTKKLCHQHRALCSTPMIRCTHIKKNGERCRAHYCAHSLAKFYDQDRAAILEHGRDSHANGEHAPSSEVDYTWTCPKCLDECSCSACRKRPRLSQASPSRVVTKKEDAPASTSTAAAAVNGPIKPLKTKHKPSAKLYGNAAPNGKESNGTAKGKAKAADKGARAANTVPLDGFLKKASLSESLYSKGKDITVTIEKERKPAESKAKQQSLLPQQLSPPKIAAAPTLNAMQTRLPVNNLLARIWLYEVLVRFDVFDIPKKLLSNLDRFDAWNEDQLRTIFERLLCFLSEVSHIRVAPQGKKFGGILKTYQDHAADPKRGEAWEAVRVLCQSKNIVIPVLEDVEISLDQIANALKVSDLDPTDTLLGSRSAGGRRAATTAALARVKSISAQENRKGDELSDEEDVYITSRRSGRGQGRKVQVSSDEEFDNEEKEVGQRRSSRNAKPKPVERKASPKRRSSRQRGKALVIEEPESGVDTGDEGNSTLTGGDKSTDIDIVEVAAPTAPVEMPLFEQRIAILCAFAELLLQRKSIADEIVEGVEKLRELEKQLKDQLKEMQKEHDDEMRDMNKDRVGMQRVGKGAEWTKNHDELVKRQEYDRIDLIMSIWLPMEAYKPRAGALGTDTDGNEYWQLTEFNEHMPANTEYQWSWSLLVLGKGFPVEERADDAANNIKDDDVKMEGKVVAENAEGLTSTSLSGMPRFYGTNDIEEIKKIISYVRYRQKKLDYDEMREERRKDDEDLVAQQKRIEADVETSKMDIDVKASPSKAAFGVDRARLRERSRAKEELLQAQELRRARIDALIQRLTHVKEYYQWHAGVNAEAQQDS